MEVREELWGRIGETFPGWAPEREGFHYMRGAIQKPKQTWEKDDEFGLKYLNVKHLWCFRRTAYVPDPY